MEETTKDKADQRQKIIKKNKSEKRRKMVEINDDALKAQLTNT